MRRRDFIAGAGAAVAWPLASQAQQPAKVARIGYLAPNIAVNSYQPEAFRQGLRELGWVEGRNIVIEFRDAKGDTERLPGLAAELVALKVDVLVAAPSLSAIAARQATQTIPIVFPVASDPIGSGLVVSLARPGGNVTGVSLLAAELVGKTMEQLTQAAPGVGLVAVLWQPGGHSENTDAEMLKRSGATAKALGVRYQPFGARGSADIDKVFAEMASSGAGALMVLPYSLFNQQRRRVVELAATNRLPAVYPWREFVDEGGLMSYGANIADMFRRSATYVDKILKGAKPADLPVEQPTKFEMVINSKTAKALGLALPLSLIARADEVIE